MLDVLTTADDGPAVQPGRPSESAAPAGPAATAIATIIAADGSAPLPVGTSMLVESGGRMRGSLTGGCVEGAVLVACQEALETGRSAVHRFGYSDEDAFAVGLMCGGTIDVLVQPLDARSAAAPAAPTPTPGQALAPAESPAASAPAPPAAMVARVPGTQPAPLPGVATIATCEDAAVAAALTPLVPRTALANATHQVAAMVRRGHTGLVRVAASSESAEPVELFVESHRPPAHLVICGANAFGQALVEAARPLGHRLTLCDPRPAFADPASFPGAEVVRAWPHLYLADAAESGDVDSRSIICVLTHDPKIDVPTLSLALQLDVAYVGAMGSRRSDRDRRAALRDAGVDDESLARLHSPIGLGLGSVTPAEVAVSILAEVIAVRERRPRVTSLSDDDAPLHSPKA
ncbi:XdhC family protein [Dietzia aurantiaca]|uniref:XdhC family protein n=1 Tax=Dietzia aurantiaca TaxID=983873 RepID=UPI001E51F837|nr:XdhC/CoxI family protein [Dietzia aurantiaca]MCD2262222.1 XdhC family protein [Dietzia aurantiaca]